MLKTWSTAVTDEPLALIPCALCENTNLKTFLLCDGYEYKQCSICGLVQINPQPVVSSVQKRYSKTDYLDYEIANEASFLRLALLSLADAGIEKIEAQKKNSVMRLLDIGCATGALLEHFQSHGWNVQGIEINPLQASYAMEKRGLTISTLPLEENKFADNYFSLIIASHLIEHLNSPRSFVHECFRILEESGHLIIITPNIASFQAKIFSAGWRSAIFDHLYLFSVKTLSKLLQSEGFTIKKTVCWGGLAAGYAPPFIKNIFDKLAKKFKFGDVMMICSQKER